MNIIILFTYENILNLVNHLVILFWKSYDDFLNSSKATINFSQNFLWSKEVFSSLDSCAICTAFSVVNSKSLVNPVLEKMLLYRRFDKSNHCTLENLIMSCCKKNDFKYFIIRKHYFT